MALTKKQEKQLNGEIKKTLEEVRFQELKTGSVKDIKDFCVKSLSMNEMKNK